MTGEINSWAGLIGAVLALSIGFGGLFIWVYYTQTQQSNQTGVSIDCINSLGITDRGNYNSSCSCNDLQKLAETKTLNQIMVHGYAEFNNCTLSR
jgi:hypothetical protein